MSEQIEQFATLASESLRLIARLNGSAVFSNTELTIAEWLALRQVALTDGSRQSALASKIGVTRQRAAQIAQRLRERGLLEMSEPSADNKARLLTVSDEGLRLLAQTNDGLEEMLGPQSAQVSGMMERAVKGTRLVSRRFKAVEDAAAEEITAA